MAQEFDGLVAVVTGGASGIGAAIAAELIDRGARVAVLDLRIDGAHPDAFAVATDIGDDASVRSAVDAVVAEYGSLDIVINNAGIGAQGTVEDNPDDEWTRVLNVNVIGIARVDRKSVV